MDNFPSSACIFDDQVPHFARKESMKAALAHRLWSKHTPTRSGVAIAEKKSRRKADHWGIAAADNTDPRHYPL